MAIGIEIILASADSPERVSFALRYCGLVVPDMAAGEVQVEIVQGDQII